MIGARLRRLISIGCIAAALVFSPTIPGNSAAFAQAPPSEIAAIRRDISVIEAPSQAAGQTLVVFLSGDGGWASIDKQMAAEFNAKGVSVVGIDLRDYLRKTTRTPDDIGRDVTRVFRAYSNAWGKPKVVLVGFSRGAGLVPFVLTRLPRDLRARLFLTALVGLPREVNLTFHWMDVIRDVKRPTDIPVLPELQRSAGLRMVCIYGKEELDSGCRAAPDGVTRIELPGGHHLERAYRTLSDSVVKYLQG